MMMLVSAQAARGNPRPAQWGDAPATAGASRPAREPGVAQRWSTAKSSRSGKLTLIERLQQEGPGRAMAGNGINDAPASAINELISPRYADFPV
ncbi:hypothetical protein FOZ76_07930 [Verticiella sediminum]|uniref:Uncharacterized protein n=1 Tax=Verticiella sediminum TaxID=1247510 RepID=A0A556AUY9_9BURK|nr:hypothetical protein [Verticiella sediminum]TSH96751.1 hypothetical protein FOZ76_07930 [Verticiella sediminum]